VYYLLIFFVVNIKFNNLIVREEIRKEIKEIKSQLSKKKKGKIKNQDTDDEPSEPKLPIDPLKQQYLENIKFYSSKKHEILKKGNIKLLFIKKSIFLFLI
jgi:hypothetical protein